ncbi:MAG: hypothetical protein AAGF67_10945 [Verrucomicrobiota bacterium]
MENSFQHRSILAVVAAALSVLFAAPELYGQIRDDESSANYLATQCAVSSGGDASNYEDYCRKLAKTVALLSAGQQERVFGFVPQPVVFARPEDADQNGQNSGSYAGVPQEEFNPGGDGLNLSGGTGTSGDGSGGGSSGEPTIVGNTPPSTDPEGESGTGTNGTGTEPETEPETNWWDETWKWLEGLLDSIIEDLANRQQR